MTKIVVSENTKKIDVLKLKGIKAVNDVDPNEVVDDDFIEFIQELFGEVDYD